MFPDIYLLSNIVTETTLTKKEAKMAVQSRLYMAMKWNFALLNLNLIVFVITTWPSFGERFITVIQHMHLKSMCIFRMNNYCTITRNITSNYILAQITFSSKYRKHICQAIVGKMKKTDIKFYRTYNIFWLIGKISFRK